MRCPSISRASLALGLTLTLPTAMGQARAADDADWPCQQILVPQITAAVVWDGPSVEGLGTAWRENPAVVALVEQISSPLSSEEAARAAIAAFAAALPADRRNIELTLAFAGVLDTLNQDRAQLIAGILRYSRDQARRADALGLELDTMVRLEQDPSEEAKTELAALTKRLEVEQRIFDERERSIEALCRRPVAVEQRLGLLARALAEHLD